MKDITTFRNAIDKDELENFFLGKDSYFVLERETGEHWPYESYIKYIFPLSTIMDEDAFERLFWNSIIKVLNNASDINLVLEMVVDYLRPFFEYNTTSHLKSTRIENIPEYFKNLLENLMLEHKQSLHNDKRLSGGDWLKSSNKGQGLWGGIIYNLQFLRERGGPDLLPSTIL